MKLKSIKVPATERFCATPRAIKNALSEFENLSIYLGVLGKSFNFDSRFFRRQALPGSVVASISLTPERHAIMQCYVVERRAYPDLAAAEFEALCLPRIKSWLLGELAKPDTAMFGYEELIYVWSEAAHQEVQLQRH